jgi:8-oxo-dGTP pyrophosphatase MutT (NUDIX family)
MSTKNCVKARKGDMISPKSLISPWSNPNKDNLDNDNMSCFCAVALFRIIAGRVEFAYVPYRRDGTGYRMYKLAGGGGKEGESPKKTIKRETEEELGVNIHEDKFHFVFASTPKYEKNHKKIFFVVPEKITQELRTEGYDEETGTPQWATSEWLKKNLSGVHKVAFEQAIDFLLEYFIENKNLSCLIAAVKSNLLNPDNKVVDILLPVAIRFPKFAEKFCDELTEIGI